MCRLILIITLLFSLKTFSQTIDITRQWRLRTGDSLAWSALAYNDLQWKTAEEIGPFERKGFPDFQNFGWARKTVVIPSTMKAATDKAGYFYLSLGKIYDADQVFFNGRLVAQTGGIPPEEKLVERGARLYKLSSKDILWDQENLIAVRIFSNFHNGGLQGRQCSIVVPSEAIFHETTGAVPSFPLFNNQHAYEALIRADLFDKENTIKKGGAGLKIKLPKDASVFYNGKFLGATDLAGEQLFFVPGSLLSGTNPDKITVYLNHSDSLDKLLFADPALTEVPDDPFQLMQVVNLEVKQGSLNGQSPVTVSVQVINNTNNNFDGKLTLTLTTDISNVQETMSHALHLDKQQNKELDFTLTPDFSGMYQLNYVLQNENGEQLTGILARGER